MGDRIEVVVTASDGVTFPNSEATLIVQVTDVNEFAPQFSAQTYSMGVSELASVGTTFGSVSVSDSDFSAEQKDVSFAIEPSTAPFAVDPNGAISVASVPLQPKIADSIPS